MKLKIATYNISGGFYEDDQSVDYLDKKKSDNVDLRLLNETVKIINDENIDVICFQEIITTGNIDYIGMIMEKTDLKYEEHFKLSPNHLVENTDLGIAILSKYPIESSIKKLFTNPGLSKTTSSGNTYYMFDKGFLLSKIDLDGKYIDIMNHHGFPFRRFNSVPEDNKDVFIEFDNYVKEFNPDVVTGDFNAEGFYDMMPFAKENYIKTIDVPTKYDGKKFDNILIKNGKNYTTKIIEALSDHFVVIEEIEV